MKDRIAKSTLYPLCLLLGAFLFFSACEKDEASPPFKKCNGYEALCDKAYNEVAYAGTHNSHAYRPKFSVLSANQNHDIPTQLNDGIRCINIKTYFVADNDSCYGDSDTLYVYHGFAQLGCEPYAKVLGELKDFLDTNPHEVLTLVIEGGASVAKLNKGMERAGLTAYLHKQPQGYDWPTLGEMIDSGKRLVVFSHHGNSDPAMGFHHEWTYFVDSHYQADSGAAFSCEHDRGNEATASLYLMNHFITIITPQPDSAAIYNGNPFLLNRARECMDHRGLLPNFIWVDFHDLGDVVATVDSLNATQ